MNKLVLRFPPTGGGSDDGFSHPGIETFQGSLGHYIAREISQNTIDASSGGEVHLDFQLISIPTSSIPAADELRETYKRCADYFPKSIKAREFSKNAQTLLAGDSIRVLRISDYGTTGLEGDDTDRESKWYALVKSAGVSNKLAGQGGSFGIGKYAPFAASQLRSVLYSTKLHGSHEVAFQGVSVLWSHKGPEHKVMQGTGYIGHHDNDAEQFLAVRKLEEIPEIFRRDKPGTDVWILGYGDADSESWARDLRYSVLLNFWPAIRRGAIRFTIGDVDICRDNLESALDEFATEPEFAATAYYRAATSPDARTFEREFDMIGAVTLKLLPDGENLPNCVAFARRAGMIIQSRHFRCRRAYAGFLECLNPDGNEFLRSMEPPRHDCLDFERLPKYTGHRKIFTSLIEWIRSCVRELNPIATDRAMDVPELARYLPDHGEDETPAASSESAESGDKEFTTKPLEGAIAVKVNKSQSPSEEYVSGAGGDEGDDGGDGPGTGSPDPKGTLSRKKGGKSQKGGSGGEDKKKIPDPLPEIAVRAMATGAKSYTLVVRSADDFSGHLRIFAIGEDGHKDAVDVGSATTGGASVEVDGSRLRDVVLSAGTPLRVEINLAHEDRLALHCELER